MHFVIVPGIDGSGPDHWQSRWQDAWGASATRITPSSWTEPDLTDWCQALDRAAERDPTSEVVLVTHSLGCLAAGYVSVGPVGHINTASGIEAWETGRALLTAFTAGLGSRVPPSPSGS